MSTFPSTPTAQPADSPPALHPKRRFLRATFLGAGLAGVVLAVYFGWLMWRVDRAQTGSLDVATDGVEAIVVLGAQVRADGTPGPDLRSRTWWAVRLYHDLVAQGQSPILITTGGNPENAGSASAVAARLAQAGDVPAQRIFQAQGGQTTAEDMISAAQIMQERGWERAVLVSHPLHLYRSLWHFQRASGRSAETYAAGSLRTLSLQRRLQLDAREAAGILWAAVGGWERMAGLGRWLERIVYG